MRTYEIYTDCDPDTLTEIAMETYRRWLEFALGKDEIGGRILAHPSGRYAASMTWSRQGEAMVAITADEKIAPEAKWIEDGTAGANMKTIMLGGGKTKVSKDGHRYRVIPIRRTPQTPSFDMGSLVGNKQGERLPLKTSRLWARPAWHTNASKFVTMSDKPGSAPWIIPPMAAYSPAAILAGMIREQYDGR